MFRIPQDGASSCAPQDSFHGILPKFLMRRSMSFSGLDRDEPDDDMSDDGTQVFGEKKRRLSLEQVKALEKSFELGNKLEPDRKIQLARALGLQTRQVAIWFQNRRARWKTKQLEKDYDVLKRQLEALKSDNNALKSQNKKLQSQLLALKSKVVSTAINLNKENDARWSDGSDNSCEVNLKCNINRQHVVPSKQQQQQQQKRRHFPFVDGDFYTKSTRSLPKPQDKQRSSPPDIEPPDLQHVRKHRRKPRLLAVARTSELSIIFSIGRICCCSM